MAKALWKSFLIRIHTAHAAYRHSEPRRITGAWFVLVLGSHKDVIRNAVDDYFVRKARNLKGLDTARFLLVWFWCEEWFILTIHRWNVKLSTTNVHFRKLPIHQADDGVGLSVWNPQQGLLICSPFKFSRDGGLVLSRLIFGKTWDYVAIYTHVLHDGFRCVPRMYLSEAFGSWKLLETSSS